MSDRDKELWGMLWRFGLVLAILGISTKVATAGIIALHIHPFVGFWVLAVIWLTPLYLAHRARSQASEE